MIVRRRWDAAFAMQSRTRVSAPRMPDHTDKSEIAARGAETAADAARTMLRGQLKVIPRVVALATDGDVIDGERVHKMRVATRRAEAALLAAESMIGDRKALDAVRDSLGRVRRAGRVVRRCDVELGLLSRLLEGASGADSASAIGYVMGRVAAERSRGERAVRKLRGRFSEKSFRRSVKRIARSIAPCPDDPGATGWAMEQIGAAFGEVRRIGASLETDPDRLHELRLALKRLRYQAELFEPVVHAGAWRGLIEHLSVGQERLGSANDSAGLTRRVRGMIAEPARSGLFVAALGRLADELERETRALRDSGRAWWDAHGRGAVERMCGNGSTGSVIGPMMDLDAAMDAAILEAQRGLMSRGTGE